MPRKYKSNIVYILEIFSCYYYIGCHSRSIGFCESDITQGSGNFLNVARQKGLITTKEYNESVRLIKVEEFDTKEKTLDREAELISEYKDKYGKYCLNISKGNKYGNTGITMPDTVKKKIALSRLGSKTPDNVREKIAKSFGINGVIQYTKDGKYLAKYFSLHEAARHCNGTPINISQACRNLRKTAYGYVWRYASK